MVIFGAAIAVVGLAGCTFGGGFAVLVHGALVMGDIPFLAFSKKIGFFPRALLMYM